MNKTLEKAYIEPVKEFRCYEGKIEKSEKAGSRQESNPGHLAQNFWPEEFLTVDEKLLMLQTRFGLWEMRF